MSSDLTWNNETRHLRDLKPQQDNPRTISESQAKRLLESWDEYNQVETLAIGPDGTIYNGHQRYYTLLALGNLDLQVDVRVSSRALTQEEWRKLTVFLHEGTVGDWDFEALKGWDTERLLEWGFEEGELEAAGFELGGEEPPADPGAQIDRAAELQEKWGTELGQLWQLGEHRLICGDCTDAAVVERVMGGERARLLFADPPYNVGKAYSDDTELDEKPVEDYRQFSQSWLSLAQKISDRQIITPGAINHVKWAKWFECKHIAPRLVRNTQVHGRVTAFWAWEPIFFFGSEFPKRRHLDIFDYASNYNTQAETGNHPCPKPLPLLEDIIENYSDQDEFVVDLFLGSGTTLIACERLGRKCRAVEIEPKYVAVTLERWHQMTGLEPRLAAQQPQPPLTGDG